MVRNYLAVALSFVLTLSMAACSASGTEQPSPTESAQVSEPQAETSRTAESISPVAADGELATVEPETADEGSDDAMTTEQEVLAALRERCDAMVNRDMEALNRLIADDIVVRHMSGREQTKQEWLSEIESERMRYYNITIENPVVEVQENTASISYSSIIEARIYGAHGTWRLSSEAYLTKDGDDWVWTSSNQPKVG